MRLAKVEIEVDQTLIDTDEDDDDPFGLAALDPHHRRDAG